jgi:uncharacterized membrane protein HdeD (DUF308 family)
MSDTPAESSSARLAKQKRVVAILAPALIVTGVVVLVFLRRAPLPIRIMTGLGDIFIGCILLVVLRQMVKPGR